MSDVNFILLGAQLYIPLNIVGHALMFWNQLYLFKVMLRHVRVGPEQLLV